MCIAVHKFGAAVVDRGGRKGSESGRIADEYKTKDMHDRAAIRATIENWISARRSFRSVQVHSHDALQWGNEFQNQLLRSI